MTKGERKSKDSAPRNFVFHPCVLAPTATGIVVGYKWLSMISVYDLQKDQRLHFKKNYSFFVSNFHSIASMHVGPEDSYVAMTIQHQNKHMGGLFQQRSSMNEELGEERRPTLEREEVQNLEIYLFNYGIVDVINTALRDPFEPLFP